MSVRYPLCFNCAVKHKASHEWGYDCVSDPCLVCGGFENEYHAIYQKYTSTVPAKYMKEGLVKGSELAGAIDL